MPSARYRVRAAWPWRCGLALLLCAGVPARAIAEYRTAEVAGLRITFDSDWGRRLAPGYVPIRFDILNLDEPRVIEIVGESSRFFRTPRGGASAGGGIVRQFVRLGRGDRVRLTLPVPAFGDNENIFFQVRENGRTLERFDYFNFQSRVLPREASALFVAIPGSEFGILAASWPRANPARTTSARGGASSTEIVVTPPRSAFPGPSGGPSNDVILEPTRLPANWLGYVSLRAVFVDPSGWEQMSDSQRTALLTWAACGGELFLVADDERAFQMALPGAAVRDGDDLVRRHFFGRIHLRSPASLATANLTRVLSELDTTQDADWALPASAAPDWGTMATRGFRLLIPGIEGVPARAYLSILIVFSLLIGPINYWVLRRKRQQVLVVLTTPLIAAIFIVLLAGYAVAVEGLSVYGRAVTFTMLDQSGRQASTRGSISLYAGGMSPRGGLQFPRDMAIFPIGPDGRGARERLTLDLSEAQRFAAGAIQARTPANFEQIGHRSARERLSVDRDASGISVVNGLGATVLSLLYRDGDRMYTLSRPLPAGGRDVLTPGLTSLVPAGLPLSTKFYSVIGQQPAGSYLAVLDRSPFWDPGVPDLVERGSFHLVLGFPEGSR
jgi:hypothetical protein